MPDILPPTLQNAPIGWGWAGRLFSQQFQCQRRSVRPCLWPETPSCQPSRPAAPLLATPGEKRWYGCLHGPVQTTVPKEIGERKDWTPL